MTGTETLSSESRVLVAWYWAVVPLGFFILSWEPAILFLFSLPVGVALGVINTTRVSSRGVRPMLGALLEVSIPWERVEAVRVQPALPGPVVAIRTGVSFEKLSGFTSLSTRRTIERLLTSVPLEVLQDAGVQIPRGWDGPGVSRLRDVLGDAVREL